MKSRAETAAQSLDASGSERGTPQENLGGRRARFLLGVEDDYDSREADSALGSFSACSRLLPSDTAAIFSLSARASAVALV